MRMNETENQIRDARFKATRNGVVLGWFDTAQEAADVIEKAEKAEKADEAEQQRCE